MYLLNINCVSEFKRNKLKLKSKSNQPKVLLNKTPNNSIAKTIKNRVEVNKLLNSNPKLKGLTDDILNTVSKPLPKINIPKPDYKEIPKYTKPNVDSKILKGALGKSAAVIGLSAGAGILASKLYKKVRKDKGRLRGKYSK